jgi:hypothetical protein
MARKPQRERAGYGDFIQVRGPCEKLLARKDEVLPGVVDGPDLVRSEAKGDPLEGRGDFRWVCPQCGQEHSVTETTLLRLIRGAKARGSRRVVLSA